MHLRRLLLATTLPCLLLPAVALSAQPVAPAAIDWGMSVAGGAFRDTHLERTEDAAFGRFVGAQVTASRASSLLGFVGAVEYAWTSNTGALACTDCYRTGNRWLVTTVGAEHIQPVGRLSVVTGLRGGLAARWGVREATVGAPPKLAGLSGSQVELGAVAVPSIRLELPITGRLRIAPEIRAYTFQLSGSMAFAPSAALSLHWSSR